MSPYFRPRTPIWTYPDRLRRANLGLIYGFDVLYGILFAFGGKADSPTQVILRQALPIPVWGALLVGFAVLAWIGYGERGAIGCLALWAMMAIASVFAIVQGTADTYGGPLIFGFVLGLHVITVYGVSSGQALRTPR